MIRSRLFWRIALGLAAVILLSAVTVILLVTPRVEREALAQIEASLLARARFLRDISRPYLEDPQGEEGEAPFRDRVRRLGEETETRLTVIDATGRVLADSLNRPATMASPHGDRPEVIEARNTRRLGTSTRLSRTTGLDLRYLALVVLDDEGAILGYARTSLPTTWIEERRAGILGRTALGAGIAALLGLGAGLLLALRLTRRLSRIADAARAIAEGREPTALPKDAKDETGQVARALRQMNRQLGERRAQIVRERNELAGILASMLEGVVAVDREQRVVEMNRVARAMLSVTNDEPIGAYVADLTRVAEVCDILETVTREDAQETREVRIVDPPLSRALQLHASPLREVGGDPGGAVLVLHDVTELRRLEAVRRDFVANVSHELKTPLTAIQGLLETVADDSAMSPETRAQFLRRALAQTGRLTALVKDLLSLSRVESENSLLERTRLDLRHPLGDAVERLEPIARRAELGLQVDVPPEPLWLYGDEEGLRQVADNLLDNAMKYAAPGGRVEIRARRDGNDALLEVQDTGIGIEPEHLGRIFERFYRVDKARSRSLGGTGLGLAIVKHLVEAHRGRISVESRPGEGTTFRVWLPLAQGAEEA